MDYVARVPAPPLDRFIDDIYCMTGAPRHRRMGDNIDARNSHRAGSRHSSRCRDGDRCRFPRSIRPEQAIQLTRRNLQVDTVNGGHRYFAGVHLAQAADVDNRFAHKA